MDLLPSGHHREDLSHKVSTGLEEKGQGACRSKGRRIWVGSRAAAVWLYLVTGRAPEL